MAQLRLSYSEVQKRDAEILQVTYSAPEEARLYFQQYQLLFPYLCDPERTVYRLYGVSIIAQTFFEGMRSMVAGTAVAVSDRLFRGEKTASPLPILKRYGSVNLEEQAIFILDKSGIIRYVHTTSSLGGLPSNAEYLRQLDKLS